jgi:predicted NBD/HSP70 family sugar kinase
VARCLLVLCAIDGTDISRSEVRGTGSEPPGVGLKRIAAALHRMLQRRDIDKGSIVGICVAMGGRRGTPEGWPSDAPWVDQWEPFATEEELARLTGIPVSRENDANCAALGEYWTSGKSSRDFVAFYMAYGIGCGIVVGGSIYRGAAPRATPARSVTPSPTPTASPVGAGAEGASTRSPVREPSPTSFCVPRAWRTPVG